MKVYFEDDVLYDIPEGCEDSLISANGGVSYCLKELDWWKRYDPSCPIYTNFLLALSPKYCWDDVNDVCDAYVRRGGKWVNLQDTTSRKLNKNFNIPKLYLAGEF